MTFSIRRIEPADLAAWIELANSCRYWKLDRQALLFEDTLRPTDEPFMRLGAYTVEGNIAGTAEAFVGEYGERWTDRARGFISVAPRFRRHGLGRRLLEEVEGFASRAGVTWLEGEGRESDLSAVSRLLEPRGYRELERYKTSRQEPARVDVRPLEPVRGRLRHQGIDTMSFKDVDSESARDSLYRCAMAIHRDMPHEAHVEWEDPSRATYLDLMFSNPHGIRDAIFVARDKEEIVGLTYLVRRPGGDVEVGDTGVLASHRRRGIGRALKLMATRYSAEHGYRYVYTDNRSRQRRHARDQPRARVRP
ncbi:MAG: GNAT family N-acetyltransferase [Candidatus Dormibacteraeota bacterium]|nr:GNAT family N-acetyltransferase [Candidatus Dormibacteraeota bacterium]